MGEQSEPENVFGPNHTTFHIHKLLEVVRPMLTTAVFLIMHSADHIPNNAQR